MGALVDKLGKMQAGQLIRAQDWNELVAAVEKADTDLEQKVAALTQTVTNGLAAANAQIGALTAWRQAVEPMLAQYFRVTMTTVKSSFALGEVAEITAQVTDLFGNALNIANAAQRPWVDFIATWGQVRAAAGFTSLDGTDDRSISVQVNQQGVARAVLRSEHVNGFSADEDAEVGAVLKTKTPAGIPFIDAVLAANTPDTAHQAGAFKVMTAAYDRADALSMRRFTDSFYLAAPHRFLPEPIVGDKFRFRWRDYRSTVMAMVKMDVDPVTPDHGRGSSSIQVTFRDWVSPWVLLDYVADVDVLKGSLKEQFQSRVTPDFAKSAKDITDRVKSAVQDHGILGKQRVYKATHAALDELTVTNPPVFLPELTRSVRNAVSVQQSILTTQSAIVGLESPEAAFDAVATTVFKPELSTAGVQASIGDLRGQLSTLQQGVETVRGTVSGFETRFTNLGDVRGQLTALQQGIETVRGTANAADTKITAVNARLEHTLATGGEISRLRGDLEDLKTKTNVLRDINPADVRNGLQSIALLDGRLQRLGG